MPACTVCKGTEFYKEAGFYFCKECQTQNEELRDEVLELRLDATTRLTKRKIRYDKTDRAEQEIRWTTWEQYNFILIGLTNELIELGANRDIKITVLRLWATYLGQLEIAFTSTGRRRVPKLARSFHKKDAEIIYGRLQDRRKGTKRKRGDSGTSASSIVSSQLSETSSIRELNRQKRLMVAAEYDRYMRSQTSSEGDTVSLMNQSLHSVQSSTSRASAASHKLKYSKHAKRETKKIKKMSKKLPHAERLRYQQKHVTTKYRTGPHVITPMKLWTILYLALRIHNQNIHLADMLRFGREGHLSYYKLDHLLPSEMILSESDINLLTPKNEITHKGMRRVSAEIAKFLTVREIGCPDFMPLINRYCQELQLPRSILIYTERLIALSPPMMVFNQKDSLIPNYEGRAMAFVIVVLKVLFGIDGITEYEISRVADKVNRRGSITYSQRSDLLKIRDMYSRKQNRGKFMIMRGKRRLASRLSTDKIKQKICGGPNRVGTPTVIVHGGAGLNSDLIICEKLSGCKKAASVGYKTLIDWGTAAEAVEAALSWLECDEFFNCGYGSVLNKSGEVQMDASIMDGNRYEIGSVAAVSDVEHPITLAKFMLENYPNTIITGEGAKNLARCADMNWISKGNMVAGAAILALKLGESDDFDTDYDVEDPEYAEILRKSWGTVGCVVWDGYNMVAGTTTGGLSAKMVGRVGDSPMFGCGTYATNLAGCSLTGYGESIIKVGLSRSIVTDIEQGYCPQDALERNIDYMENRTNKVAGGVALQKNGCWGCYFTSPRMPYAVVKNDWITSGADPYEKIKEKYYDPDVEWPCRCK